MNIKLTELLLKGIGKGYEGNESEIHRKLREKLRYFAIEKGYYYRFDDFPEDKVPDVLLCDGNHSLFVGDAKVSDNETIANHATTKRVCGYIDQFFQLIDDDEIAGGIIAIITDDHEAAEEWKKWLENECKKQGCANIQGSVSYDNQDTYIIYVQLYRL